MHRGYASQSMTFCQLTCLLFLCFRICTPNHVHILSLFILLLVLCVFSTRSPTTYTFPFPILWTLVSSAGHLKDDDKGSSGQGNSRARMLAQQREIQSKRRASAAASGGMIRSSQENQFTPAVRQFSAPKSVRDGSAE